MFPVQKTVLKQHLSCCSAPVTLVVGPRVHTFQAGFARAGIQGDDAVDRCEKAALNIESIVLID